MAIALHFAARSDIGLGRYVNNQDSGYAGPHLLVVCDGMGGHAGGDVASSTVLGRLIELDDESPGGDALAALAQTLREANNDLRDRALTEPRLAGMGTTATVLMRYGSRMALAHIGDSRAYLLREGELVRLTHDHTFVQTLVDEGRITAEEAGQHPQKSIITRVLSGDPDDEPDLSVREVQLGDRYLICSDGLTGVISDATLAETLAQDDPATTAEALIQMALRGGGPDNITCVVAHAVDPGGDLTPGTVPEVVGAAALDAAARSAAATSSPAALGAALTQTPRDVDEDQAPPVGPPASTKRWMLRTLVTLLVVGLLGSGGYSAYAWTQKQYFVGADDGHVAIYRGLPQDIGPIRLSSVFERQDVTLSALPEYSREQVQAAITADDLADARAKVSDLRQQSLACQGDTIPIPDATGSTPTGTLPPLTPTITAPATPSSAATAPRTPDRTISTVAPGGTGATRSTGPTVPPSTATTGTGSTPRCGSTP